MTDHANHLLSELMRLTETERAAIAEQLLGTLSPGTDEISDGALEQELDARLEEHHQDPSGAVPWAQLRAYRG